MLQFVQLTLAIVLATSLKPVSLEVFLDYDEMGDIVEKPNFDIPTEAATMTTNQSESSTSSQTFTNDPEISTNLIDETETFTESPEVSVSLRDTSGPFIDVIVTCHIKSLMSSTSLYMLAHLWLG